MRAPADDWDGHWAAYERAASSNPAQAYRRRLVFELLGLEHARPPLRLLELGSGQGDFARDVAAAHPGIELVGLELSETGVGLAAQKVPSGHFFARDLAQPFDLPERFRGWATHAVCSEVLEHVDDPVALLRNVRPFLAPGCELVVTVPGGPMSDFDRHIGHRRHFTTLALRELIRDAGLTVDLVRGAGFPFFNLYRLVVLARGRALIRDVDGSRGGALPLGARVVMQAFDKLFRWNARGAPGGWQLVARAVEGTPIRQGAAI